MQTQEIRAIYASEKHFHKVFDDSVSQWRDAQRILGSLNLDLLQLKERDRKDLGNRWSKRWSRKDGKEARRKECVLLQWYARVL